MTRIYTLSANPTDTGIQKFQSLDQLEAAILALSPRGWWDATNPAYYTAAGGALSVIKDRSGNGFDLTQPTVANQPLLGANYWGAINSLNRDAAVFDGTTDLYMTTPAGLFDGTTAWSLAEYVKYPVTGTWTPWSANSGAPIAINLNNSPHIAAFVAKPDVVVASGPLNVGLVQIATITQGTTGGLVSYLEGNGSSGTYTGTGRIAMPSSGDSGVLGAFGNTRTFKMNGGVGDIMLFNADLSGNAAALAAVRSYFAFKYR